MAEPSKERIAAALALAEAVCALATAVDGEGAVPPALLQARQDALRAYRATAPKLRTRAEVDAEIVAQVRDYFGGGPKSNGALGEQYALIQELCREETAPEEPNRVTDHDADMREERPCGCEESEALRKQLQRIRSLSINYPCNGETGALVAIRHCIDFGEP